MRQIAAGNAAAKNLRRDATARTDVVYRFPASIRGHRGEIVSMEVGVLSDWYLIKAMCVYISMCFG